MQHDAGRERLTRKIGEDRTQLKQAVRDLGLWALFGLNLPRRIRRRPLPWTLAALGVAAFVLLRQQQRKQANARGG